MLDQAGCGEKHIVEDANMITPCRQLLGLLLMLGCTALVASSWASGSEEPTSVQGAAGPKIAPKDLPVFRFLVSTFSPKIEKLPLDQFLTSYIPRLSAGAIKVIVDEGPIKEAKIDLTEPIDFVGSKLKVGTVLTLILSPKGLAYYVKDGSLRITTKVEAKKAMMTAGNGP
jgi:hypothetical protein